MAINRLQFRRDSLADFQQAALTPTNGEPQYIVEEKRIRIGDDKGTHVSRQMLTAPNAEGSQFHALWNVRSYGNGKCIDVPVTNGSVAGGDGALEPLYYAASAPLPEGALQDAGTAHITASGDYLPGSTDPALILGFEIGQMEQDNAVVAPRNEPAIFSGATSTPTTLGGINISAATGFVNCLGDYEKPVTWDLDARVCFLGRDAISPFKTSLGAGTQAWTFRDPVDFKEEVLDGAGTSDNANVRVVGRLVIQDPFTAFQNSRSIVSMDWLQNCNGSIAGAPTTDKPGATPARYANAWDRGAIQVSGGSAYEAMGFVPSEDYTVIEGLPGGTVGDLNDKVRRLCNAIMLQGSSQPGQGRFSARWWRPLKTVIDFSFEERVDAFDEPNLWLHLKVGGPMQSNPSVVYDAIEPGLSYDTSGLDVKGVHSAGTLLATPTNAESFQIQYGVRQLRYDQDNTATGNDIGLKGVARSILGNDYACRIPHLWADTNDYHIDPDRNNANSDSAWNAWYYRLPVAKSYTLASGAGNAYSYTDSTKVLSITEASTPTGGWKGVTDAVFAENEEVSFDFDEAGGNRLGNGTVSSTSSGGTLVIENVVWSGATDPGADVTNVVRTDAGEVSTLVGNADGEWNCAWRRMAADRRDRMRIHHTTAFFFGGRPGINDYRTV